MNNIKYNNFINNFKPDYKTLSGFEAKHSGNWIAKFSGDLGSLNVINGYAPITNIDLKFYTALDDSVQALPNGIQLYSIKGYERPSSISATMFEVDSISVSQALRAEIKKLDAYKRNRVLAYSDLDSFASTLSVFVYHKDGSGVAETYNYKVIPKSSGEYTNDQESQLVTFSVEFLVIDFTTS